MTELPDDVVAEAERLTRLARQAVDPAESKAYRTERDALIGEYDYTVRIREDDDADVLVCYPSEWMDDGTVRTERIEDVDRGVERRLSGAGDPDDWEAVAETNDELVEDVAADHEDVHAANARALADFASNHYAKPITELTRSELREFIEEYLPRNAWPTDRQLARVEASVEVAFEKTDISCPLE
ncbi:rnhA operon protein [Halobacteria archaeon HArc-gm2]|nr:rnhA operon protein [Halobacteria archaeon HArc-gm2]